MDHNAHLLVCVDASGAEDLEVLRIYRRLPDDDARRRGFVRVIDDSGEDYLYPESAFLALPAQPCRSHPPLAGAGGVSGFTPTAHKYSSVRR
jgi:hypothetical protein